jgi:hypothetical protein
VTYRTKSCWVASVAGILALVACGASAQRVAQAQSAHLNWTESGDPHHLLGGPIVFKVRNLRIGPGGWSVEGSVANKTTQPLRIVYAHEPAGHNAFGIAVVNEAGAGFAHATRFRPRVPILLEPGEGWSGTFSGPDQIAPGVLVRVSFGQFGTPHADRFTWVSDHAYRVR